MSSFNIDNDFEFDYSDDENILLDEAFLNEPIDTGLDVGEDGEVMQEMEATFEQGLQQRIDIGDLDPRNPRDKPLIQIGQEMDLLGLARDYIQDFLMKLRQKQDDDLMVLPFLNARYVANAKIYLDEVKGKSSPESIKTYIKTRNEEYKQTREGHSDEFPYLDAADFYRYIKIDENVFN